MSKSKFNFSRGMKTVKSVITANSPILLVGATITGVVTTGVLAARAGYKARGIVDAAQAEKGPEQPLTTQEKVQLTWLCYAVPAVTGASTIASCLGVHFVHTKRFAELAGLYAITAHKLDDYKEEAENLLGAKKTQQLSDAVAQRSVDEDGPIVNNQVIINEGGTELIHDDMTGRYFTSSMNMVEAALNEANAILLEGELDLNEVYDRLGLDPVPFGDDFGWTKTDKVKRVGVNWGNVTSPDGRAALSISFRPTPKPKSSRA